MRKFKSLADRLADQAKAREKRAELARKMAAKPARPKRKPAETKDQTSAPPIAPLPCAHPARPARPWAHIRAGDANLVYQARATSEFIGPQPWTNGLVSTLLSAADEGTITLCLVWPTKLASLSLIHALANIERVFAKDLLGLRTLLYPGAYGCRAPMDSVLADRQRLSELYRKLWIQKENGSTQLDVCTSSKAFLAALEALNDIAINAPNLPNPSLAELIPTFVFDPGRRFWSTTAGNPLERTLSKVDRLARRRALREKVKLEWAEPDKAPGALMAIHNTATKEAWRVALSAPALRGAGRPEVLLLNATQAAARTNYSSVRRIPAFLRYARENGFTDTGAVIITDDPKSFFILRKQLYDLHLEFSTREWAGESDGGLLSQNPLPSNWRPAQRSNSHFGVSIVDRDASELALEFQRLSALVGTEESSACQSLLKACVYVLRLSNMPAGYSDLTAASTEAGGSDHSSQQNAWTPVRIALDAELASGALNSVRASVVDAIGRAEKLIDDWNDATPMASRMLAFVQRYAVSRHQGIALVMPNKKYMLLAHRFLERKLRDDWPVSEGCIEWHTLAGVGKSFTGERKGEHFAFIGINPDVLRILLTHVAVPHGTAVLVAYRQAESTLTTLSRMKDVEAFKAYRGRIGLLAQELEQRLAEVPKPLRIGKLRDVPLTFRFGENDEHDRNGEQAYFKFELEGGKHAYAAGWVYCHAPDEDPPFRRTATSKIVPGDFIFDMSDELRAKLESSLELNGNGESSVVNPVRTLLKLYHQDVRRRCELLFKSTKRSALAREIHSKMVELDARAAACRPGRVYYWLAPQAEGDTRPHASRDAKYFKVFCKALEIDDETASHYWNLVRNARRFNQSRGRELVARYAEILFQPESAAAYRKVPEDVIQQLQQEALHCVYRVERVVPPPTRVTTNKKGERNARS